MGMDLSLKRTALTYNLPTIHRTVDHLGNITTEQQKLKTSIELENIEDVSSPKGRSWTPISYAIAKL